MKTIKSILWLLVFGVVIIHSNLYAQTCSVGVSPWCTGGITLGGGEVLGSTSGNFPLDISNGAAYPIRFWTNASQKATILSNGNVGIGTATPDAPPLFEVFRRTTSNYSLKFSGLRLRGCSVFCG